MKNLTPLGGEVWRIEMTGMLFVHIVWISEKRLMTQGTDGFPRGNLDTGIFTGQLFSLISLDKTATERWPPLREWIREIFGFKEVTSRSYEEWYNWNKFGAEVMYCWSSPVLDVFVSSALHKFVIFGQIHVICFYIPQLSLYHGGSNFRKERIFRSIFKLVCNLGRIAYLIH